MTRIQQKNKFFRSKVQKQEKKGEKSYQKTLGIFGILGLSEGSEGSKQRNWEREGKVKSYNPSKMDQTARTHLSRPFKLHESRGTSNSCLDILFRVISTFKISNHHFSPANQDLPCVKHIPFLSGSTTVID